MHDRNDQISIVSNKRTAMSPFRPIDRATPYLLPPSVEEWLPKDHLARFVVDIVEQHMTQHSTDRQEIEPR